MALPTGVRLGVPRTTEWQRIGNQIDAAMVFARFDFVNVHQLQRRKLVFQSQVHFGCCELIRPN
jgi:hypothetical protein